jgi:hypothetical protein
MVSAPAFLTSGALLPSSFVGRARSSSSSCPSQQQQQQAAAVSSRPQRPAVAALEDWGAGLRPEVPTEEELRSQDSVALYAGPREDLSTRSFATPLAVSWAGDLPSFGAGDVTGPFDEEGKILARILPEDPESTEAFAAYARNVKDYRSDMLEKVANQEPNPDGMFVSNYRKELVFGVKCVEYWS